MLGPLRDFFSTPARQALGWAGLGITGIVFAALGVMLILGGDDSSTVAASTLASPTPTRTPTAAPSPSPSATASPTASPTPTETPTPAPTATRAASSGGGGSSHPTPVPPAPTPEPTPVPVVTTGGPYCDAVTTTRPPTRIFGRLRFGGAGAPVGTTVTILFDGVTGRSEDTKEPGGYKIDWAVAGSDCANRVGAAIAIMVNGTIYASAIRVGADAPFVQFDIDIP